MYILIAVFLSIGGMQHTLYGAANASHLGEFSSIQACQAAASAVQKEANKFKDYDYGIRFVCAMK